MKFGGTSVANIKKIQKVAKTVIKQTKSNKVVVVLSAMAGVTNQLQSYIDEVKISLPVNMLSSNESDMVMTSGEQVTVGLLSMILNMNNIKSIPLLGWKVPIVTDSNYDKSKNLNIGSKNNYKN